MAEYTVSHPQLPEGINGVTTVETSGGIDAALDLASSHVAAILRHRNIVAYARPEDVADLVTVEAIS
ncbi:hypothetical protein H7J07_05905 [Mycobacterium koreense]|nr:hypothetical protein [Mycolicibacillus koreensis]MCV7247760.1 hypothetical protein [Mycolicibacillus koreensis]BBY54144.1 hypothetical protein MKOR_13950 [Mycolicibacillus koreensis]